jgi:hypothetical protein
MHDGTFEGSPCVERYIFRHSVALPADHKDLEAGRENFSSVNEMRGGF